MKLFFKQLGETGKPLVIVHGLFGMSDNWHSIGRELAGEHRVFLPDMRNHGRSPHSIETDYYRMSEDLGAFAEDAGLEEMLLLGHSMGGKVAMRFAVDRPDLVKKLAVVDIAPKAYPPLHNEIFDALLAFNPSGVASRSEANEMLAKSIRNRDVRLFLLKNLKRLPEGGYGWRFNLQALHLNYPELAGNPLSATDVYGGETLFVRGAKSEYILPDADLGLIRRHFPNSRLLTIPGAGHWVHAEQPGLLLGALEGFFA